MKATLVDSMPAGAWLYELKFDGYRALALRGGIQTRIQSRNQKDLGHRLKSHSSVPWLLPDSPGKLNVNVFKEY
jgi:ATP-dependent DNA ligase